MRVILGVLWFLFAAWVSGSPTELPYIQSCCEESIISNSNRLIQCVHNASTYHFVEKSVSRTGKNNLIEGGKLSSLSLENRNKLSTDRMVRSRFAFVTFGDEKVAVYSAFSFSVNEAFAEYNGYVLMLASPDPLDLDTRDVRWNKVKIIENAFHTWAREVEFLIWLDADLILLNFEIDLDSIVNAHPNAHLWACPDIAASHVVLNSGTLILRNSEYVVNWLLPTWWNFEGRTTDDQVAFTRMYRSSKDMRDKVVIMAMDAFNSIPPASVFQTPVAPVLHLMGEHNFVRIHAFTTAFRDICRAITERACSVNQQPTPSVTTSGRSEGSKQCNTDSGTCGDSSSVTDSSPSKTSPLAEFVQPQFGVNSKTLFAICMLVYFAQVSALMGVAHKELETSEYLHVGFDSQYSHLNKIFISVGKYAETMEMAEDNNMFTNETDYRRFIKGDWNSVDERLWEQYMSLLQSNCSQSTTEDDLTDDISTPAEVFVQNHLMFKTIEANRALGRSVMGEHPNDSSTMIEHLYREIFLMNLEMLEYKLQQYEDDEDSSEFQDLFEKRQNLVSFHVQMGIRHLKVQHRVVQNTLRKKRGNKSGKFRLAQLKSVDAPVTALFREADVITDFLNKLMATSPPQNQEIMQRYHNEIRITLENYLGDPTNPEDQRASATNKYHQMYKMLVFKCEPYVEGRFPVIRWPFYYSIPEHGGRVKISAGIQGSSRRQSSSSSPSSSSSIQEEGEDEEYNVENDDDEEIPQRRPKKQKRDVKKSKKNSKKKKNKSTSKPKKNKKSSKNKKKAAIADL